MENRRKPLLLALDLQNFADEPAAAGGDGGNSPSQPAAPAPSEPAFQGTPNWGMPNQGQANQAPAPNPLLQSHPMGEPQAAPPVTPLQQEFLDFAGRKVPVVDPVLKDIHKDYSNLQGTYTKTSQELAEYRGRVQALEQMVQQFQQQPPQAQPQQAQEPVDPEKVKEDFMNRFYDDPLGAIQELVSKSVEPAINPIKQMVEPITKERQLQEQINQVSSKFSDFNDMVPAIQQLINEMPHLAEQGLETLYYVAKGRSAQTAQPAPTPEQLLQDPNFVQQHILSNPNIQQQIVSQYVQSRQQTNQQIPVVMGGHPGGQAPAMPENKPKTIGEGSKAFLRALGL